MDALESSNLFCVVLDEHHEWMRYHHLFQKILQKMLQQRMSESEIDLLHYRASRWLDEHGMIDEAMHHALAGNKLDEAGQLVTRHRYELMDNEQWTMKIILIRHSSPVLLLGGVRGGLHS